MAKLISANSEHGCIHLPRLFAMFQLLDLGESLQTALATQDTAANSQVIILILAASIEARHKYIHVSKNVSGRGDLN